jgi:glycosyltransferase involved in cell wall biosynthesis
VSSAPQQSTTSRLLGVLVTYRRPDDLKRHLACLREQTRPIDHLFVVDNAPDAANEAAVREFGGNEGTATYLASRDNTGAAGGIAQGLRAALRIAGDDEWIVLLDDDNPPRVDDLLERLFAIASDVVGDPSVAAVGVTGARFDWRRARLQRPTDEELHGLLDVDFIGGGQFPLLRARALRDVGVFRDELFWGLDDLDFGLRLRSSGYRLVLSGDLTHWAREFHGRLGLGPSGVSVAMSQAPWRRYYTMRNLIDILRRHDRSLLAARVALTRGLGKAGVHFLRRPTAGWPVLRLTGRAVADGWRGRLGRTVEPGSSPESSGSPGA